MLTELEPLTLANQRMSTSQVLTEVIKLRKIKPPKNHRKYMIQFTHCFINFINKSALNLNKT